MSSYFDTENWLQHLKLWAAAPLDTCSGAIAVAVLKEGGTAQEPSKLFVCQPPGITAGKDFAFIVIGDTGEGDAWQHILFVHDTWK